MSDWQPIETAPKDGARILLAPLMVVASWDFGDEEWIIAVQEFDDPRIGKLMYCHYAEGPTHWMPLPEPPK